MVFRVVAALQAGRRLVCSSMRTYYGLVVTGAQADKGELFAPCRCALLICASSQDYHIMAVKRGESLQLRTIGH